MSQCSLIRGVSVFLAKWVWFGKFELAFGSSDMFEDSEPTFGLSESNADKLLEFS